MSPPLYDYNRNYATSTMHRQHTNPSGVDMRDWYGHDMTIFPFTNLVASDPVTGGLVRNTNSAFYMPLIYDALGRGHVFPFSRPTTAVFNWASAVERLRSWFQARGITMDNIPHDGPYHAPAEFQEQLFGERGLIVLGQEIELLAIRLVRALLCCLLTCCTV